MIRVGIVGIFLLVIGPMVTYLAYKDRELASTASDEPEEITLKALIARGAEGNPNIVLKDYVLCPNFVYQETSRSNKRWSKVWVPIIPSDAPQAANEDEIAGGRVQAILFSVNVPDEFEIEPVLKRPALRGR